jgi:hypothetical protein
MVAHCYNLYILTNVAELLTVQELVGSGIALDIHGELSHGTLVYACNTSSTPNGAGACCTELSDAC